MPARRPRARRRCPPRGSQRSPLRKGPTGSPGEIIAAKACRSWSQTAGERIRRRRGRQLAFVAVLDGDLLVLLQHDRCRVTGKTLAIDKERELLAVAGAQSTHTLGGQPDAPLDEELAEQERCRDAVLDVDDAVLLVGVQWCEPEHLGAVGHETDVRRDRDG